MKIRLSAHGAYHHQSHVVWIPTYRKKILKGEIKQYLEKGLFDVQRFHPDVEIETLSIQVDHVHVVMVIPPKYAVSASWGRSKPIQAGRFIGASPGSGRYIGGTNSGP